MFALKSELPEFRNSWWTVRRVLLLTRNSFKFFPVVIRICVPCQPHLSFCELQGLAAASAAASYFPLIKYASAKVSQINAACFSVDAF